MVKTLRSNIPTTRGVFSKFPAMKLNVGEISNLYDVWAAQPLTPKGESTDAPLSELQYLQIAA